MCYIKALLYSLNIFVDFIIPISLLNVNVNIEKENREIWFIFPQGVGDITHRE